MTDLFILRRRLSNNLKLGQKFRPTLQKFFKKLAQCSDLIQSLTRNAIKASVLSLFTEISPFFTLNSFVLNTLDVFSVLKHLKHCEITKAYSIMTKRDNFSFTFVWERGAVLISLLVVGGFSVCPLCRVLNCLTA